MIFLKFVVPQRRNASSLFAPFVAMNLSAGGLQSQSVSSHSDKLNCGCVPWSSLRGRFWEKSFGGGRSSTRDPRRVGCEMTHAH